MKALKLFRRCLLAALLLTFSASIFACEIHLSVKEKTKKPTYKNGDEVVVLIKITKNHRSCTVGIEETKFTAAGLKIMGATDWKETQPKVWERKMKLVVSGTPNEKLALTVSRKCSKEDSIETLTLRSVD